MSTESKYFIAIVPPEPTFSDAMEIKHYFKDEYNCKAPLRSPPHITLHMPFQWKISKERQLIDKLVQASKGWKSFTITLKNFGAFPPRVIYMAVQANDQLQELQQSIEDFAKKELNLFNATRYNLPFKPHLTVAFRDLKKQLFPKAWEEFENRKFEAEFTVNSFHLLKHDGKKWQLFREIHLHRA